MQSACLVVQETTKHFFRVAVPFPHVSQYLE